MRIIIANERATFHMSFTTPSSVPSGMSMPVLEVEGHIPDHLKDFAGDVSFVVDLDPPLLVQGTGRVDGQTVRFHEKDLENSGKDIRVWQVRDEGGGGFVAVQTAAY